MECTIDQIPKNSLGVEQICLDGAELTLVFKDGLTSSSSFHESFQGKEAVRGENERGTYERFSAPPTEEMRARGVADLRIEENPAEEITLLIVEAKNPEESVSLFLPESL